jgi:hypothetical protein
MVVSRAQPIAPIAGRSGTSPIGTFSSNTGATASTQSSYAVGAFTSGLNILGSTTTYELQNTDYQGLILFDTSSAVTVTLNYALGENFTATILNIGSGQITLTPIAPPPDSVSPLWLVNGATSLTLASGAGCIVAFAERQWYAYVGATFIPVVPVTFSPVTNEWLTGYNALTGAFAASQPAFSNVSGTLSAAQLPANVPVVSFGSGAPSGSSTEGYIYFNTATGPYTGYVYHSGAWQQFS